MVRLELPDGMPISVVVANAADAGRLINALRHAATVPGNDGDPKASWTLSAAECASQMLTTALKGCAAIRDKEGKGLHHARWMAEQLVVGNMSETKACRWLGYIQGVLVTLGVSTLEREKARNLAAAQSTAATGGAS